MKYILFFILISFDGFSQSGIDILKMSSEKIKGIKNVKYNIYDESSFEKVTADVTIERGPTYPVIESKIKVSGLTITNEGSRQISFSFNGLSFDFIDPKTAQLTRLDSISFNKLGRTGLMQYTLLALAPYTQKEPFDVILKQLTKAERLDDTTIYAVPCYTIKVTMEVNSEAMGNQTIFSIWYINKENLLICGRKTKTSQQYLKIKSIDDTIADGYFNLSPTTEVKRITGTEPLNDGLLPVGSKAPDWTLPSSNNKMLNLKDLKGKVVLLDFWGTWCAPCLKAMPEIQAIYDQFKGLPVEVIGVSVEMEKNADPIGYMKRKGYTYPTLTEGYKITKDYKVLEFPSIYIINKEGVVVHAEHGGNRENFKEDIINRVNNALRK